MQSSSWTYDYQHIINQLDQFAARVNDNGFNTAWTYTKLMVAAHGNAIKTLSNSTEDCTSLAWSHFESTFDEAEEEDLLALTGIVIHLVNTVPFGQTKSFHEAIEVGFSMARGFSKEEALEQLQHYQAQTASANTSILSHTSDIASPSLQIITGGLD